MVIAGGIGIAATLFSFYRLSTGGRGEWDFAWAVGGARDLLSGVDPYNDLHLGAWEAPLFYPLPALFVGMAFVPLPHIWGAAVFIGISSGLLAFGLTRRGLAPLVTFLSLPYLWAASIGQWSIVVTAAGLIPELSFLLLMKPTLGLSILAGFPSRKAIAVLAAAVAATAVLSIVWFPQWFGEWLVNVGEGSHVPPILVFPGWLLPVALLYRKLPTARLLFVFACVPQWLDFYDQVVLFLIPRSSRQYAYLAIASWAWMPIWRLFPPGHPFHLDRYLWDIVFDLAALGLVLAQGRGWATTGGEASSMPDDLAAAPV